MIWLNLGIAKSHSHIHNVSFHISLNTVTDSSILSKTISFFRSCENSDFFRTGYKIVCNYFSCGFSLYHNSLLCPTLLAFLSFLATHSSWNRYLIFQIEILLASQITVIENLKIKLPNVFIFIFWQKLFNMIWYGLYTMKWLWNDIINSNIMKFVTLTCVM